MDRAMSDRTNDRSNDRQNKQTINDRKTIDRKSEQQNKRQTEQTNDGQISQNGLSVKFLCIPISIIPIPVGCSQFNSNSH